METLIYIIENPIMSAIVLGLPTWVIWTSFDNLFTQMRGV